MSIGGVPISGFLVHKSFGKLRPLLGVEAGVVLSELVKGRTISWEPRVGCMARTSHRRKPILGVDPIGKKALADLHLEVKRSCPAGR